MEFLGKHVILELYECEASLLSDPNSVSEIMQKAATIMGATVVESAFHHFSPLGVSGVVIIMESHLTIHTWPEYSYAAIDIFTCGDIQMDKGIDFLKEKLRSKKSEIKVLNRGRLSTL
ncbi:adenosylmethionine decarboxylase [Saprospiraceae bacterium]|jgi:S-adenosylmethionine decarboxylase|nr:adenosylmethionine decarboxylase [Saprospiraceae bacterium]